jgi:L-2-hydroxycarboxylate dehydrogenase (NAD+)
VNATAPDRRPWWDGTHSGSVQWSLRDAEQAIAGLLAGYGVDASDSLVTARHLVEASARGYPAHGVERVPQMCAMLGQGTLAARAQRRTERRRPGVGIIDACRGLGPPAAEAAVRLARTCAGEVGIGLVGLRNAGHLGILAPWAERCAGEGSFGLVVSSSEPGVVAPGTGTPVFGTNPVAYAWPDPATGGGSADFSTAAISRSELLRAVEAGEALPPGAAADRHGRPTQVAAEAVAGGLLPVGGGTKGTLLSLLAALLAGPVVGGPPSTEVSGTRQADKPISRADFFLVIDLRETTGVATFQAAMGRLFSSIAEAGADFRVPGSASHTRREKAELKGIMVSQRTSDLLLSHPTAPGQ